MTIDEAINTVELLPVGTAPAEYSIKDGKIFITDAEGWSSSNLSASDCRKVAEAFSVLADALEVGK